MSYRPITRLISRTLLVGAALALFGCQNMGGTKGHTDSKNKQTAKKMESDGQLVAHLRGTSARPQAKGTVRVEPAERGLKLSGKIEGLKPNGTHAFHVHQYGDCGAADGTSAGSHYNPEDHPHELPPAEKRHAGDFGNITANGKGVAEISIDTDQISMIKGNNPVVGRAFVVHAEPDTGEGDSGEAGARIACGVIGFAQQK